MANWDFVFPYDERAADWLDEQKLPRPAVQSGNRLPSTAEVIAAWTELDPGRAVLIDNFDWRRDAYVPENAFKLRGDLLVELRVLRRLSESCGQLWMYPDTGEPAIIIDAALDPERTCDLYSEANAVEHRWAYFYRKMYPR